MIYSPNGEPLNGGALGRPTCEAALSRWFDRIDADHDGMISRAEFAADVSAQFARMDIDHNGYLLPEELDRYRLPYRQGPAAEGYPPQSASANAPDGETKRRRHHAASSDGGTSARTGGHAQTELADPVMSADTNNDFKVTPQEFSVHAERTFIELDAKHDGLVSRAELLKTCIRYGMGR